jgi:hypothetical protein
MNLHLADLFCRHVATSFDKQCHFWDIVAGMDWHFEVATGLLSFGDQFHWRADILGTESDGTNTWLWAWANESSQIPESLLHTSLQMKDLAERYQVPELRLPEFPLGEIDGEFIAMLASGECRANAYFRAPYDGGAAFLLIRDERFPPSAKPSLLRVAAIFPQALVTYDIPDHKAALTAHLEHYGLNARTDRNGLTLANDEQSLLTASFDANRHLTRLNVESPNEAKVESPDRMMSQTLASSRLAQQTVDAPAKKPVIAFGPEMPGWGSWAWIGADLQRQLNGPFTTVSFRWDSSPSQISSDVLVIVKHVPPADFLSTLPDEARVVFCPVDFYGSAAEIDGDARFLRRCSRIVVHCERLRRYFEPYAPVVYMDHHVKFAAPPRRAYRDQGYFLWIGVRTNLPPLVDWIKRYPLPAELRILTNFETSDKALHKADLGISAEQSVLIADWSPQLHGAWTAECRAVLDIKGTDFRARHKPPAKAIDFIASGAALAMNADSSPVEHLAGLGFDIPTPLNTEWWLSQGYWDETRRFGDALRELLSIDRVGRRWRRLFQEVLDERAR